ncbi:DEAD/DEAH box helicase [Rhodobacteraceae bacterium]|nr:DEAD/DEAH box helicase [Paracoccaceae bacterium]
MKQALAKAIEAKGYTTLTAVQEAVTDPDVTGKDLLVSAQTGSGKTLGFGLAIAPALFGDAETFERASAPLALVITPTRELALQVKRELAWLFEHAKATLASTVGGMDMRDERRALARGAHIVVATPGRLRDHIMRGSIDLSALKAVVLDEADEMLDLGFREDLEFILEQAPTKRQTLMFSATVPATIAKLAKSYQKDAVRISTTSGASQHADIDYRALKVSARDGENAIINVLRYYEAPNAIVFCNTRAMVNRLTTRLSNRGFSVVALSGELSQKERTHALQSMRDGRARVCVATDVAARGIDLPNLELVIHAELPTNQDTLLHRSGRTGRAGRKGVSALIVPPAAQKKAHRLLAWAKLKAEWAEAPSAEDVSAKDDERMMSSSDWTAEVEASNREAVDKLAATYTAEQLAAAYIRMYRERRSAPEELSDISAAPPPRAAFGPSTWFTLEGGHAAAAEPRRILPMVCKMGNLSREDIGAIRIQSKVSFIEIKQSSVEGFLKAVGPKMELEDGAALTQLDAAPNLDRGPSKGKPTPRTKKPYAPKASQNKAPASAKETGTTKPVDWNDDPAPRAKKPKPNAKPNSKPGAKPGTKPKSSAPAKHREEPKTEAPKAEPWKPRKTKPKSKFTGKPPEKTGGKSPDKAGGKPASTGKPETPAGKPSSKKNRARQIAKAGMETPRRKNRTSKPGN